MAMMLLIPCGVQHIMNSMNHDTPNLLHVVEFYFKSLPLIISPMLGNRESEFLQTKLYICCELVLEENQISSCVKL